MLPEAVRGTSLKQMAQLHRTVFWLAGFAAAMILSAPSLSDTLVGPLTFDAQSLRVEGLRGTLNVEVTTSGHQFIVVIEGDEDKVDDIKVRTEGTVLIIEQEGRGRPSLREILTFGFIRFLEDHPDVTVSVPTGAPLTTDDFAGEIQAGDLDAPLVFQGKGSVKGQIGNVTEAYIDLSGSSELVIGKVEGNLLLDLSGSTEIRVASSGPATIGASGSSEVRIGPVEGGLKIDSSGSTDIRTESVNGPVSIRSSGSGDIDIGGGQADPFVVNVSGAANVSFAGVANDPDIKVSDTANIRIGSITGTLRSSGSGNIVIGD